MVMKAVSTLVASMADVSMNGMFNLSAKACNKQINQYYVVYDILTLAFSVGTNFSAKSILLPTRSLHVFSAA